MSNKEEQEKEALREKMVEKSKAREVLAKDEHQGDVEAAEYDVEIYKVRLQRHDEDREKIIKLIAIGEQKLDIRKRQQRLSYYVWDDND